MTLADRIVGMHQGRIQAAGLARDALQGAANKFVAGFIGSPPMNFLAAELSETGGVLRAEGPGFSFVVPDGKRAALAALPDRKVEVGIRPSAMRAEASATGSHLDVEVLFSEYVGALSVLGCQVAGQRLLVEVNSETPVQAAGAMRLRRRADLDPFFHPTTEIAL